jgi:hypothetical protein
MVTVIGCEPGNAPVSTIVESIVESIRESVSAVEDVSARAAIVARCARSDIDEWDSSNAVSRRGRVTEDVGVRCPRSKGCVVSIVSQRCLQRGTQKTMENTSRRGVSAGAFVG